MAWARVIVMLTKDGVTITCGMRSRKLQARTSHKAARVPSGLVAQFNRLARDGVAWWRLIGR